MKKPLTLGIKDATARGVSGLIRTAEEEGMVVVQRNGTDVALIFPVTPQGIKNFLQLIAQAAADPSRMKHNPNAAAALSLMGDAMRLVSDEPKGSERDLPEDKATLESDLSAGQMGDTRRRRKSPASS